MAFDSGGFLPSQLVRDLSKARAVINRGWLQHGLWDSYANHCMVGAAFRAADCVTPDNTRAVENSRSNELIRALSDALPPVRIERRVLFFFTKVEERERRFVGTANLDARKESIIVFNDARGREKAEVLAVFDKAIAKAKASTETIVTA